MDSIDLEYHYSYEEDTTQRWVEHIHTNNDSLNSYSTGKPSQFVRAFTFGSFLFWKEKAVFSFY